MATPTGQVSLVDPGSLSQFPLTSIPSHRLELFEIREAKSSLLDS